MNKQTILVVVVAALLVGGVLFLGDTPQTSKDTNPDIPVSRKGIHWHPELTIIIKGEKQTIPANVGIGTQYAGHPQYDHMMQMTNMHTHDDSGMLHWEVMRGPVQRDDVQLGQFFSVWGKQFAHSRIFDLRNGSEGTVTFLVNGKENAEFEDYLVNDKDRIAKPYPPPLAVTEHKVLPLR